MRVLLILLLLLVASPALAEECSGGVCVAKDDLKAFVEIAKEKKCLQTEKPEFDLDPVNIVVDRDGRIFFSGADPHPYKLRMKWCQYNVEAEGKVKVLAAVQEPPTYGFRFRPKAYTGLLLIEPFRDASSLVEAIDAGLMFDALYWKSLNLNVHVGFRSFGGGLGLDIFRSFGGYVGYALTWDGLRSNPEASLWFAFW